MQYLFDETGRRYLDALQQRAARRPQPPARREAGDRADARAQHQHALSARAAGALRRAPHRDAAGAAARLLLRQLRQRGQRAGAAARARAHAAARPRSCSTPRITATRRRSSTSVRTSSTARAAKGRRRGCTCCRCPTPIAAESTRRDDPRGAGREVRSRVAREAARSPCGFIAESARASADRSSCRTAISPPSTPRPRGRRRLHRRRSADGLRPDGHALLRLRSAARRPRHRRAGQADRQRLSARRSGDDAGDRRVVRQRHGVLQHVRRQHRVVRGRAGRARRRAGRAAAGARARGRRAPARAAARARRSTARWSATCAGRACSSASSW